MESGDPGQIMLRVVSGSLCLVLVATILVAGCAISPEDLGLPESPQRQPIYKGVHLPVGGMDSVPVGTTDTYMIRGRIHTRDAGSGATFSDDGRACAVNDTRLHCK